MPHASRTAMCSSRTPVYCTGISQPAKSTRRAPAASWRSNSGVRRSIGVAGEDIGAQASEAKGSGPSASQRAGRAGPW